MRRLELMKYVCDEALRRMRAYVDRSPTKVFQDVQSQIRDEQDRDAVKKAFLALLK